jgi:hypothetical protein
MDVANETKQAFKQKPTYPTAIIESNIRFSRPYPQTWRRSSCEWDFYPFDKSSKLRCLFDVDRSNRNIHLRTIDSLSNQHLDTSNEDYIFKILGRKANAMTNGNQRNGLPEKSPGDKSYRAVEYSPSYFHLNTHSREPIRRCRMKTDANKINSLLDYVPNVFLFDTTDEYDLTPTLKKEEYFNEVQNVRSLDEWKAAQALKAPFKVVNREDKTTKYRPRINR